MARSCIRKKFVYKPSLGKKVKVCAAFSGTSGSGTSGTSRIRGKHCIRKKRAFKPSLGRYVDVCAKFSGTSGATQGKGGRKMTKAAKTTKMRRLAKQRPRDARGRFV